jgi:hypothetical protein
MTDTSQDRLVQQLHENRLTLRALNKQFPDKGAEYDAKVDQLFEEHEKIWESLDELHRVLANPIAHILSLNVGVRAVNFIDDEEYARFDVCLAYQGKEYRYTFRSHWNAIDALPDRKYVQLSNLLGFWGRPQKVRPE